MNSAALSALAISLKVACWATLLILPPAILFGFLLARREFRGKTVMETLAYLPLVLPPTAVGYVLLRLLSLHGLLGAETLGFDPDLLFTWKGAVLASSLMSFPLVARTSRVAFEGVDPRLEGIGRTLGLGPARTFFEVSLPLARRGLLAAAVLGFGRALGEFGATVIVAGNIPGKTQTLALAVFNDLQLGHDREAWCLVGITLILAFSAVASAEGLLRRRKERR
jgi:molybdate transport system permease protein